MAIKHTDMESDAEIDKESTRITRMVTISCFVLFGTVFIVQVCPKLAHTHTHKNGCCGYIFIIVGNTISRLVI